MLRHLVATILLATALLACGPGGPGGLSRADAIAAAQRAVPGSTGVVGASTGPISSFEDGQQIVPGNTQVWAVVLSGQFPFSCGPAPVPGESPRACPAPAATDTVLIDFRTGQFLLSFSHSN